MREAQLPDGTILEFPDDTADDVMTMAVKKHLSVPVVSAPTNSPVGQDAGANAAFGMALANAAPFGQRITSGIGAVGAAAMGAGNVKDLYNQAQENTQRTLEANPNAALAGSVAGVIPTLAIGSGLAKAISKPIFSGTNALANIGNIAGQSIKGAAAAAPIGAAYAAGEAKSIKDMPEAALSGAEMSAAIGAASPLLLSGAAGLANVGKGAIARNADKLEKVSDKMFKDAGQKYEQMRASGAVLNKSATDELATRVENAVAKLEFIPELNPKTMAIINRIKEKSAIGEIGLNELDQYRRLLGRVGATEDGVSAGAARKTIDEVVNGLTGRHMINGDATAVKLLNEGRAQYAKAAKFDDIVDIVKRSEGDANKLKANLTRFLNKDENTIGWTKQEIKALKEAAGMTAGEKFLKLGGKFGIDLGSSVNQGVGIGPIVGALTGAAAGGGGVAAAVPAVGTVMRQAQKYIARSKVEKILKAIEGK